MTLIKTGDGITDISGKYSGTVFKRDKTGLHIQANPKRIKHTPSLAQSDQQNWYAGKKYSEGNGPAQDARCLEPPTPPSVAIYQLADLYFWRQLSILKPVIEDIPDNPEIAGMIEIWVDANWHLLERIPGLTRDIAISVMAKFMWDAMVLSKGNIATSFIHACTKMLAISSWCAEAATATVLSVWGIFLALGVYAIVDDFYSRDYVRHQFVGDEVVIRDNNILYWGRVIARTSFNMFNFLVGPPLFIIGFLHKVIGETPKPVPHDWLYTELNEEFVDRFAHWETNRWENLRTNFTAYGFYVRPGLVRAKLSPKWYAYKWLPVGWYYTGTDPFDYIDHIYDETPP